MTEDPSPSKPYSLKVEVNIQEPAWTEMVPPVAALAKEVVHETLANKEAWHLWPGAMPTSGIEVSVCFAGDEFVQNLNQTFRDKNKPTNVLSFPNGDLSKAGGAGSLLLGDVVLARGVVLAEAKRDGKSPVAHTSHLLVHGVLHLLGFSHDLNPDAEDMETLEVEILKALGIANPYEEIQGQRDTS